MSNVTNLYHQEANFDTDPSHPRYKLWVEAEDHEELGRLLSETMHLIAGQHATRLNRIVRAVSALDNLKYESVLDAASGKPANDWKDEQALTFNVIASAHDTLTSKIGKNKILPRIITSNAKWAKREQSARLEKYVRGLFKQLRVEEVMERALVNCILTGDGFVHVHNDGENISLERILPDELFVDFLDAYYDDATNQPCIMYRTKIRNIREVMSQFPEAAPELDSLYGTRLEALQVSGLIAQNTSLRNSVVLIEAWARPLGDPKSEWFKPGRHVITCGSLVLLDEEWDKTYFPFVRLQYRKPERGFYTRGLYQDIAPMQRELDFTFRRISDAQRLCSAPKILVKVGKAEKIINSSRITNQIGEILEVDEMDDIRVIAPPPLSGEQMSYLTQLKALGYEQSGISQLSATSKVPSGIDGASARALREYNDIETERYALLAQEWERAHGFLAELLIKEIASNGDFTVRSFDRNNPLEVISFKDLEIDIDDISVAVFPASALPSRPEARFQAVQEYIQAGFIDQKSAMELMNSPDLDSYSEIKNAPKKAVDRIINMILDKQESMTVEPFFDLKYLIEQATLYYNYVIGEWEIDAPKTEQTLTMLRQLIEDANYQLQLAAKPPEDTTQPPGAGAPPPGSPSGLPEGVHMKLPSEAAGMSVAGGAPLPQGAKSVLPADALASLIGGGSNG